MFVYTFSYVFALLHSASIVRGQQGGGGGGPPADGGGGDLPSTDTSSPYTVTGTACLNTTESNKTWCSLWLMNSEDEVALYIEEDGVYPLVNMEAVTVADDQVGSASTFTIYTSGVPNYQVTVTQAHIDALDARPRASVDFTTGSTTLQIGDVVDFGDNIGYLTNSCEHGFWPPGPVCPDNIEKELIFPAMPSQPATAESGDQCFMALNEIGLFLNGVSMFGWADGFSYNNEDAWHNLAGVFEIYDVGICGGHAASGQYHHHSYSSCIQDIVADDGSEHSPKIGMTPDGYFHYGLYQETDVKAQSCWKTRDYSDASDPLGCGGTGERTCVLVDNLDPDAGTKPADNDGPTIDEVITSLSSNTFDAVTGSYYQDMYFDEECFAQGGEYLDQHNGHTHDDLGYHYHATEAFPWFVGPTTYFGQVDVTGWNCDGFDWDAVAQNQGIITDTFTTTDTSQNTTESQSSLEVTAKGEDADSSESHAEAASVLSVLPWLLCAIACVC